MLAKAQAKVPADAGVWPYEPKWDGFLSSLNNSAYTGYSSTKSSETGTHISHWQAGDEFRGPLAVYINIARSCVESD